MRRTRLDPPTAWRSRTVGVLVGLLLGTIVACTSSTPRDESADESGSLVTASMALADLPPNADLVDLRDGVLLLGLDIGVPAHSDATRTMFVDVHRDGVEVAPPWGDVAIADARVVEGGAIVWLTDTGVLHETAPGGDDVELAHEAHAPLGVSPSGRYVTWVSGEIPEVEVRRLDRTTGAIDAVAPDHVPSWSPVPMDDGRVAFVTVRASLPQRAIAAADGGSVDVRTNWTHFADVGDFATGPGAPTVIDDVVVARAAEGIAAWDATLEPLWRIDGHRVAWFDGELLVRIDDGWRAVDLETGEVAQ